MCDDEPVEEMAIDSLTVVDASEELWEADPNCDHDIQPAIGGGIRCTKCSGWFCY